MKVFGSNLFRKKVRGQTVGESVLLLALILMILVFTVFPLLKESELTIALAAAHSAALSTNGVDSINLNYTILNGNVTIKPNALGDFDKNELKKNILASIDCTLKSKDIDQCLKSWQGDIASGRYNYMVE